MKSNNRRKFSYNKTPNHELQEVVDRTVAELELKMKKSISNR